jgi:hypothetical protein
MATRTPTSKRLTGEHRKSRQYTKHVRALLLKCEFLPRKRSVQLVPGGLKNTRQNRRTRSTSSTAAMRMGVQLLMEPNRADRPYTSDTCGDGCHNRLHRTCSRIDGSAGHTGVDLAGFLRDQSLEPLLGRACFGSQPPSSSWHGKCSPIRPGTIPCDRPGTFARELLAF